MELVKFGKLKEQSYTMKESLRALKTNIQFCGDDIRTLLVTSSVPNEGKSTVALDLARSLTESGKRVLFIDSDMRKSVLAGRLRASLASGGELCGLSHYLSGQRRLDEVLYGTQIQGLFMIFAGPSVPNPTEILEKKYFQELLNFGKEHFNYIIIDCAPIGAAIDAAVVAKYCDGAIIVIGQGMASARMIQSVKKQLEASGVRILGAVLNKVNNKKSSHVSGYYGNYYGSYYGKLVLNAIDACNVRQALEWSWGTEFLEMEQANQMREVRQIYEPRIDITYDSTNRILTVEDNGIGINEYDLKHYVAKIGESYYTSRDFENQKLQYEPFSYYGIGLSSCFTVSKAILIESKKDRVINTAWNVSNPQDTAPVMAKWFGESGQIEYVISQKKTPGTRITIPIKPSYAPYIDMAFIVKTINHYMLTIPIPIHVKYDVEEKCIYKPKVQWNYPLNELVGMNVIRVHRCIGAETGMDRQFLISAQYQNTVFKYKYIQRRSGLR